MVQILPPVPQKESFGSIIGRGVGESLRQSAEQRMQKQALSAEEERKRRLLQHEYNLKGGLEEKKQAAKFAEQVKMLKELGFDLGEMTNQEKPEATQSEKQAINFEEEPTIKQSKSKLIPQEKINAMALVNPAVADKMQKSNDIIREQQRHEEDVKRKTFESERSYHAGYSKELEKNVNQLRDTLPKKEMALDFARNAVETGDVSYFSPDKLADATGIDLFRTAKGAQLLTAGKENLLSNMSRVGAKAQNQWFEQRLNSMFPKIGQSREANLTTQEMLEGEAALDRAYIDEFDRLSEEDEKNFGYVRKDISKRVHQSIKPLENHILNRSSYRMKEIEEEEKGLSKMKSEVGKNVIKGAPLTFAMAKLYHDKFGNEAIKVAEKNGYRIPTLDEWKSYQQRPQEFREEL